MTCMILALFVLMISSITSSPNRCSCVNSSSCSTQLYGRLPKDIALLGLYAPCPVNGEVLCCDRTGLEQEYADSDLPVVISKLSGRGREEDERDRVHINGAKLDKVISHVQENRDLKVDITPPTSDDKVQCGCIPRGICLEQFIRVSSGEECGDLRGMELCCVPRLAAGEEDEELLAKDNLSVKSLEGLPCVFADECKEEYSLSASHIANYGVMTACVHPQVRCVQLLGVGGHAGQVHGAGEQDEGSDDQELERNYENEYKFPFKEALFTKSRPIIAVFENKVEEVDPASPKRDDVTKTILGSGLPTPPKVSTENYPPLLTLVPCSPSCSGTAYSPFISQHRELYGVLAECSPGLVRCIYHLDLQVFLHEDNFNLPVFDVQSFVSFLFKSVGEKPEIKRSQDVGVNASNEDVLDTESNKRIVEDSQKGKQIKSMYGKKRTSKLLSKVKSPERKVFFSADVSGTKVNTASTTSSAGHLPVSTNKPISSNIGLAQSKKRPVKQKDAAVQTSHSALLSILGRLNGKHKGDDRKKQNRREYLPTRLLDRMKGNSAAKKTVPGHHLPEATHITGVEIVMPRASTQLSKVMLHMDKDMMEIKLDDEQLLPVLQALISKLGEL